MGISLWYQSKARSKVKIVGFRNHAHCPMSTCPHVHQFVAVQNRGPKNLPYVVLTTINFRDKPNSVFNKPMISNDQAVSSADLAHAIFRMAKLWPGECVLHIHTYTCLYDVCMYVRTYVRTHVCMYACIRADWGPAAPSGRRVLRVSWGCPAVLWGPSTSNSTWA